ncbi:MAG: C4-dicarboxylate ABC transporter permease [Peptococcaceae bacterium BRH_c4a]|nr:MAG: C4-dicarboxylate ABC transporter permease [Peptococcaceae bacterium BRH_c4a]KJS00194.1 MAG: C4-dicarboxylate ABC transporter permease [Peptococcaceae bacterium BRH_c4a]
MVTILFIVLLGCLLIGMPIWIGLLLAVMAGMMMSDLPLMVIVQKTFTSIDSFPMLAIPFFILAGAIMEHGGMSRRLIRLASVLVGALTGGLAMVSVLSSMLFGALTGSAPATTAAIGGIMIKEMEKKGYDSRFSAALLAISGELGILIPPSIPMILFAITANVSVLDVFMGGIVPGIIFAITLMVMAYIISASRGYRGEKRATLRETAVAAKDAFLALLTPVIILGGIYGGVFTPTEAGVVACVYALLIGFFVYRELDMQKLARIAVQVTESSAAIMLVVVGATAFGWLMTNQHVPQDITAYMSNVSSSPYLVLFLLNLLFFVTGFFMNQGAAILILTPMLLPVITKLGVDPAFYGVIMVMVLGLSQVTPPVALSLFVASRISGRTVEEIIPSLLPFLIVATIVAFMLTYMPGVVMLLPNLLK